MRLQRLGWLRSSEAADFQLLAQYQAYATVMHHGHRSSWFSLATRPAPPAVRDPALLYAASHARYGIPSRADRSRAHRPDQQQRTQRRRRE